ncbi:MAG: redoxin domain-containing protein [Kiritimatiellaeota bacterium]|nr:redoxin domain-containing protein [Kiritimatiellota bacterium]
MKSSDRQEAVAKIEVRLADTAKKRAVYFYLAWPLLALGMALLFSETTKKLGFGIILAGVVFRVLYYRARHSHIALSRYKRELGGKSSLLAAIFIIILGGTANLQAQLNNGDATPPFTGLVPVNGTDQVSLAENRKNVIRVVEFWATWDKTSKLTFNLLSEIQSALPVEDVVFIQVTKENKQTVEKFLEKLPVKPVCAVYVDPKGALSDKFLGKGAGIPQVFIIGEDGKILWKGEVVDLRYVLGKVVSGEFDLDIQLKIIPLRKRLQRSMQLGRHADAKQTIDDILRIDPADELAARVRLFFFERDKKMSEAVPFIDSLLRRSPKTPFLHLLKLDALNLTDASPREIRAAAKKALDSFGDNPTALNRLANLLINRLRFGTAPLDVALKASSKAVDLFFSKQSKNPTRLARYLATRAKAHYLLGRIDDAVEGQEQAVKLMKNERSEKRARMLMDYYKSVKAASKSPSL